jgi:AAA domain/Primase C terminal 2 (PriCT-2)
LTDHPLTVFPNIPPVIPTNIPALLKGEKRWVVWRAGPYKPTGKFDKIPVDPLTGRNVNALEPANWLTFDQAMDAHRRGMANGIGIVLSDQLPIVMDGTPYYLTAIDLDQCLDSMSEHRVLWRELGKPYVEVSPSGNGLRMLGLCSTPLKGGNAGDGRELYFSERFMTITGIGGRGDLVDLSAGLTAVQREWFASKTSASANIQPQPIRPTQPEVRENVANVMSMLDVVSSDTDYETWRAIIWSLASTGWASARPIAHLWSKKAPERYDAATLDRLFDSFDPTRGITLGTLTHHACKGGWTEPSSPSVVALAAPERLLLTARELQQLPSLPYRVRDVFPSQGFATIYGEPGAGKSFLAMDLAYAISSGRDDWFGFKVAQAPVVYVALEGKGGIGKRTLAIERHYGVDCPDALRFMLDGLNLLDGTGIEELSQALKLELGTGAVIFIDTLNQASPGADENTSAEMGKIIACSQRLAKDCDGLVILVHHAGKDRSRGLRGHSSLHAALDTVIEVRKSPAGHEWCLTKAKDDESGISRDFDLVPYTVGRDDYGDLTSCAVRQALQVRTPARKLPTGKHQKQALAELSRLLQSQDARLDYRTALINVAAVLDCPAARIHDRAKEAVDALIRDGHLLLNEGAICLA